MALYEILREADRGDAYQQMLARGTWTKTSGPVAKEFTFTLNPLPLTDTLILKARNGDNPPIQLSHLQLVSTQLRSVDKSIAALGPEETLKKPGQTVGVSGRVGSQIFWLILALVVVVLLVVIARLLPKSDAQPPK